MSKKSNNLEGVCLLCGNHFSLNIDSNENHKCDYSDLLKSAEQMYKDRDIQFNKLMKAEQFIKDNKWHKDDKKKIKDLLLMLWCSIENEKFKIK